jgi:hypothetical protein
MAFMSQLGRGHRCAGYRPGIGWVSKFVSLGNKADVDEVDLPRA